MDVTLRLNRGIPDVPWARHELMSLLEHDNQVTEPESFGLVVTELVTNALLHGSGPVEVHVTTRDTIVRIEVHDGSARMPEAQTTDFAAESGRGLVLVAGLVERWGVDRSGDGKRVWAELAAPPRAATQVAGSDTISLDHRSSTSHGGRMMPSIAAMPSLQLRTTSQ